MAAAVAAAAMALRTQTINTADKQLETMYKSVDKLKDVGFPKFQDQLDRQAFAYEWGAHILDATQAVPAPGVITLKDERDIRNAYLVITSKCDGHPVENILEACPQGDAQTAFVSVRNYFHRNTQAGRTYAYKEFFGATMANTNSNVTAWIAVVPRLAKILVASGGQADQAAQLSIFLAGLLPEFEPIKIFLDQVANLDYNDACRRTLDYAHTKDILELTKNGLKNNKNNTFTVGELAKPPGLRNSPPSSKCRGWPTNHGCRYGEACKFEHTGPGKLAPLNQRWPRHEKGEVKGAEHNVQVPPQSSSYRNSPPASNSLDDSTTARVKGAGKPALPNSPNPPGVKCNYCNGTHLMRNCPALATDNANGKSDVCMVDGTTGVDHVFVTNATPPNGKKTSYSATKIAVMMVMLAVAASLIFDPPQMLDNFTNAHAISLVLVGVAARFYETATSLFERHASSIKLLFVLLFILASLTTVAGASTTPTPHVCATSYFNGDAQFNAAPGHYGGYEWCSDTGTNRFVTNDTRDFVPGTFVTVDTTVAVGGGNATSPGYGTVLIKSRDTGSTIQCNNVLLMPKCSKKLMPASTFIQKGCTLKFHDYDKVSLLGTDKEILLKGRDIGGLYYYHAETIHAKLLPFLLPPYRLIAVSLRKIRRGFLSSACPLGKRYQLLAIISVAICLRRTGLMATCTLTNCASC